VFVFGVVCVGWVGLCVCVCAWDGGGIRMCMFGLGLMLNYYFYYFFSFSSNVMRKVVLSLIFCKMILVHVN